MRLALTPHMSRGDVAQLRVNEWEHLIIRGEVTVSRLLQQERDLVVRVLFAMLRRAHGVVGRKNCSYHATYRSSRSFTNDGRVIP